MCTNIPTGGCLHFRHVIVFLNLSIVVVFTCFCCCFTNLCLPLLNCIICSVWLMHNFTACLPECRRKTKELLNDKCSRIESKRKKLLRSQTKEKSRTLELTQSDSDPQRLTKVTTFRHLLGIDVDMYKGPCCPIFLFKRKQRSFKMKVKASQLKSKHFFQVYQELLVEHSLQISELELQQDNRVAETLCDHWKV